MKNQNRHFLIFLVFFILFLVNGCSTPGNMEGQTENIEDDNTSLHSITYHGNGSDEGEIPINKNLYKSGDIIPAADIGNLNKADSIFTGWNTEKDGSGTSYKKEEPIIIENNDINLYAQWSTVIIVIKPTIKYNGNGNTGGMVPVDYSSPYRYNDTVTVLNNFGYLYKTGYDFAGWNMRPDGTGTNYDPGDTFNIGYISITLYANWKRHYNLRDIGPAGGYIFYDKGHYSNRWRYMEAAPASTEWNDKQWGLVGCNIANAEGITLGTGKQNTIDINNFLNLAAPWEDYAAQLCDRLVHSGYNDWFLPSKDELNLIYSNLFMHGLGDFSNGTYEYYWTSSESSKSGAWSQRFRDGRSFTLSKLSTIRVRAVRQF